MMMMTSRTLTEAARWAASVHAAAARLDWYCRAGDRAEAGRAAEDCRKALMSYAAAAVREATRAERRAASEEAERRLQLAGWPPSLRFMSAAELLESPAVPKAGAGAGGKEMK